MTKKGSNEKQEGYEVSFIRSRMNCAFRTGWACLVASLAVELSKAHGQWMAFPVFCYVIAVTVVGESRVGRGCQDYASIVIGTIQGVGMSMLTLLVVTPARFELWVAVVCVAMFNTPLIVYPKSMPLLSKRVALAQTGIFYVTAYSQRHEMDAVYFPLRIALTTLVGATSGMLALFLPVPRFAFFHVRSQVKLSLRITSQRLRTMADAFCENNRTKASFLALQHKSLSNMDSDILNSIDSNEGDISWEIPASAARSSELKEVMKGLKALNKYLAGMELALEEDLHVSGSSNNLIRDQLRDSLVYITDWACFALANVKTSKRQNSTDSEDWQNRRNQITEEAGSAIAALHHSLLTARQGSTAALLSETNLPSVFFVSLLTGFVKQTKKMIELSTGGSSKSPALNNQESDNVSDLESGTVVAPLPSSSNDQSCCSCSNNKSSHNQQQQQQETTIFGEFHHFFFFSVDRKRLMRALKMSITMAAATLVGTLFDKSHGYWGDISLSLGFVMSTGGSFKVAYSRAQGTVLGSIYGLLIGLMTQRIPSLRMVAMVPWVVFTSFLRKSPSFGPAGAVSVFTGAIVILGQQHKETDKGFFIIRVVEAFVGMSCYILTELLVSPRRSASLARDELITGMRNLRQLIADIALSSQYSREKCAVCMLHDLNILIRPRLATLKAQVSRQKSLVKDTQGEPDLWFTPFPAATYSRIVEAQAKTAKLLQYVCDSSETLLDICKRERVPIQMVQGPLHEALGTVMEKSMAIFGLMEEQLEVKPLKRILHRREVEGGEREVAVEVGNSSSSSSSSSRLVEEFEKGWDVWCKACYSGMGNMGMRKEEEVINKVLLCFSGLAFSCHGVLKETALIQKEVHELLQMENPSALLHSYDTSTASLPG